jgi:hypothetical protein
MLNEYMRENVILACWAACQIPEGVPEEAVVDAADAGIDRAFIFCGKNGQTC